MQRLHTAGHFWKCQVHFGSTVFAVQCTEFAKFILFSGRPDTNGIQSSLADLRSVQKELSHSCHTSLTVCEIWSLAFLEYRASCQSWVIHNCNVETNKQVKLGELDNNRHLHIHPYSISHLLHKMINKCSAHHRSVFSHLDLMQIHRPKPNQQTYMGFTAIQSPWLIGLPEVIPYKLLHHPLEAK